MAYSGNPGLTEFHLGPVPKEQNLPWFSRSRKLCEATSAWPCILLDITLTTDCLRANYVRTFAWVYDALQAKALNNIRSATKSISESVMAPIEVNLDMAVEYIQVRRMETLHHGLVCFCPPQSLAIRCSTIKLLFLVAPFGMNEPALLPTPSYLKLLHLC